MIEKLYLEVAKEGNLTKALDLEFEKIKSQLRCSTEGYLTGLPVVYARVEYSNKSSTIYLSEEERLFLPSFWRNGVCLAHGKTNNIASLAEAINFWLSSDVKTEMLQDNYQFVRTYEKARAFDKNKEVEYTWNLILNDNSRAGIRSFVELAIKDNVLSKLFPFTSLSRLCFSRCTGFPYTTDTPIVIAVSKETYEVRLINNEVVGTGTAIEAIKMVKENLPLNIQPAIAGTAEDFKN